ncbi:MAG TPA: hypothetical protein QGF58_14450 [Myxococcota bacterium]|nr:hypothetical protein [Myxococcota bacterium]
MAKTIVDAGFDSLDQVNVPIPLGIVTREDLWSGPTPGDVGVEIRIENLGPDTTVRLTFDVCAKRHGSGFNGGMWLLDASPEPTLPQFAPEIDPQIDLQTVRFGAARPHAMRQRHPPSRERRYPDWGSDWLHPPHLAASARRGGSPSASPTRTGRWTGSS